MEKKQSEKQQVYRELGVFAALQLICAGLMFGVFALLHRLDGKVLLGGAVGVLVSIANYFIMAVGVFAAANKAEAGDAAGGQRVLRLSMLGRYLLLILVLVAGAKSGWFNVIAMLVPVILFRPLIFVGEFFRRKDG